MAAASDLTQAGDEACQNALGVHQGSDNLQTALLDWAQAIAAALPDIESADNRTVSDWISPVRDQAQLIPALKSDQNAADASDAGVVLFRSCRAASTALAANRITSGQATALLNAYNSIWT